MYYANQTLRNIKTNQLAALHPLKNISTFNWEAGRNTNFIDEFGKQFADDIKNWDCVRDWFDRSITYTKEKSTSKFIETGLKQYLVFGKEREKRKQQALEEWRDKLLKRLETENHINSWCADGSKCFLFRKYFMDYVKVKPLIFTWNQFAKDFKPNGHTFTYKKRKFLISNGIIDDIVLIL